MPFSVAYLYRDPALWIGGTLGSITCKALFYVIPVFISASVFTMMVISFDRFYAVFYPWKKKFFQKPKVLSAIIWISSFGSMIPFVLMFQTTEVKTGVYYCWQEWPWAPPNDTDFTETYKVLKSFHICLFVILYALPLSVTLFIYFLICRKLWLRKIPGNVTDSKLAAEKRLKRKVTSLLVITCVVFAVCWFPVYVNHYFTYVRHDQNRKLPMRVQLLFNWIAHTNSALNPCLYILLNEKFRQKFQATLHNLLQFGSSKNNCSDTNLFGSSLETNITHASNVTPLPPKPDSVDIPLDLKIGLTSAYVVIFLVALFGNSVGFYVVLIKKESSSTSVTNLQLFIGNMAVADLLLTITIMPFSVAYLYRDPALWIGGTLGSITCKALFYVMPVFISASVFTMMLISFDRFYAVFFPLKEKFFQKPKVLSAIIWILSFGLMTPYVLMFQLNETQPGVYHCLQEWPWAPPNDTGLTETYRVLKSFHICVFVIVYALPLSITIIIYSLI
ncbi:unnamed protein product [Porites evermanni]|uniref:G-protein coupled receptors family 1 profile domain-containing protein n=1 Tax=Porites evermanni TaxID=104178 RepID=A0ABN8M969_9CNID|nr:unnamed protein product [Porites evermanni]